MRQGKSFSSQMQRRHLRVLRTLGYVLTLDTQEAWREIVTVLQARLTVEERSSLAFAALEALDRDDAILAAEAVLCTDTGQPIAPLFGVMDEAAFWADISVPEELEAYCLASFTQMKSERQTAFLQHVLARKAA